MQETLDAGASNQPPIAFLLPDLGGGGAVKMMLSLAQGIADCGHHVDLLVMRNKGELSARVPAGLHLHYLRGNRSSSVVPSLVAYLRRSRPVALFATEHYSGLPAMYASLFARTGTHYLIRQDSTWSKSVVRLHGFNRRVVILAMRLLFRRATIIAVSNGVAEDFSAAFPVLAPRVRVVYNPVVAPDLRERAKETPSHSWVADKNIPLLVAVGRLAPEKGYEVLLQALALLNQIRPVRLLILGEGPSRGSLEQLIEKLRLQDRCELAGFQHNPYAFMAHADLLVLSSLFEGLPTVLIEALALGVPVVATDCPHGPREILDGGRFGTLVPVEDPDALAAGIANELATPRQSTAELAPWIDRFSVERSVTDHLNLIEA